MEAIERSYKSACHSVPPSSPSCIVHLLVLRFCCSLVVQETLSLVPGERLLCSCITESLWDRKFHINCQKGANCSSAVLFAQHIPSGPVCVCVCLSETAAAA